MKTSIIIVTYNGLMYTRQCLASLFLHHPSDEIEVIVVDNNSSDSTTDILSKEFPLVRFILLSENKGFGPANNIGAGTATGDILFFVNNDTIVTSSIIESLESQFSVNDRLGIIGPKLLNEDGSFQISFGKYPTIAAEREAKEATADTEMNMHPEVLSGPPVPQDWVTGAALMIKRQIFRQAGGFDERYFMYFEDVDLCKRVSDAGYAIQFVPTVSMIHLGGKSYDKRNEYISYQYRRSQLRFYDKHNSIMQRMLVRLFLFAKFMPKLLSRDTHILAFRVIRLVFSHQGKA
jgi:GT2 family glycosyltransferase